MDRHVKEVTVMRNATAHKDTARNAVTGNAANGNGTARNHGTHHGGRAPRRPRASLAVRAALAVLAVLLAAVAAACILNMTAIRSYNQATQSLDANLKSAAAPNTDLDALKTRQQQTDAQFNDAGAFDFLLLPQVKTAIHTNSQISQTLTTRTSQEIVRQQTAGQANGTAGKGTLGNGKQSDGLSQEQRDKVEAMLKANQQSASPSDTQPSGNAATPSPGSSAVRPW
jgi:hypothetical protein